MGQAWYEVDAAKYLIWALERVGLMWNARWHAPKRTASEAAPSGGALAAAA